MILLFEQYRYKFIPYKKNDALKVLEIGIGNDSPSRFKKLFPNSVYHGIDKDLSYNLNSLSINSIDKFYKIDLETETLTSISNNFYDYILIAHVIEHINNGENVIKEISKKLKKLGVIYIEYPRKESANFPSMKGTLNFYDDPTHKRFYDINVLSKILEEEGLRIIKAGVKRDISRIIGIPFMAFKSFFVLGYIRGSIFWDLLGFANVIIAKKF